MGQGQAELSWAGSSEHGQTGLPVGTPVRDHRPEAGGYGGEGRGRQAKDV